MQEQSKKETVDEQKDSLGADLHAEDDLLYVGQQEYEMLRMQSYLQHEILAHWRPPIGIPTEASCEISFVVDWESAVTNVAVCSTSGVLMYDVSASSALLSMNFPAWAKGKSFRITFKQ